MEYTTKKLADLAGVSVRTLRYYDEIGLLKPCRVNSSGYRIYGEKEVSLLQQILLYRSLDMKLEDIQKIIYKSDFNVYDALKQHHKELISKRNQLEQLILTVEKTLAYERGEIEMSNKEKFEAFKKNKLDENEAKYGNEVREKYGNDTVEKSNKKWMNMSENDFNKMQEVENEMFKALLEVIETNDLNSKAAKTVFEKHKEWLCFSWPVYSSKAHIGLAQMYTFDERFSKYYNDRAGKRATEVLHDAIVKYAK